MKKTIYMDNAATTKTAPEVVEAMLPYFTEYYGNPSSVYELAGISKKAVNEAREKIIGAYDLEDNAQKLMLKGVVSRKKQLVPALVSALQQ